MAHIEQKEEKMNAMTVVYNVRGVGISLACEDGHQAWMFGVSMPNAAQPTKKGDSPAVNCGLWGDRLQ